MPDPFEHDVAAASDPQDEEPKPTGVTPNKPDDPSVYGGRWGDSGGQKPSSPASNEPDRPDRIRSTPEDDVPQPSPTAPPSIP